jgi:hypothetical protein
MKSRLLLAFRRRRRPPILDRILSIHLGLAIRTFFALQSRLSACTLSLLYADPRVSVDERAACCLLSASF